MRAITTREYVGVKGNIVPTVAGSGAAVSDHVFEVTVTRSGKWQNVQVSEASKKHAGRDYGYNRTESRWSYDQQPPQCIVDAAVADGLVL